MISRRAIMKSKKGPATHQKQGHSNLEGDQAVKTCPEIDYSKNFVVLQEIRTVVISKPKCECCGAMMNLVPYRIGGREEYEWNWVCPNYSCPDKWPNGAPQDAKVIELPGKGKGGAA